MSNAETAERLVAGIHELVGTLQAAGGTVSNEDVYCACLAVVASGVGSETSRQIRDDLFRDLAERLNQMIALAAQMAEDDEVLQ